GGSSVSMPMRRWEFRPTIFRMALLSRIARPILFKSPGVGPKGVIRTRNALRKLLDFRGFAVVAIRRSSPANPKREGQENGFNAFFVSLSRGAAQSLFQFANAAGIQ